MADLPKNRGETVRQTLREVLVARYDALLRRLTRRLGSSDLANVALHDAWLRLEREPDLSAIRDPFAYVIRVASNEASEVRRKDARRAALLGAGRDQIGGEVDEPSAQIADEAPDPERVMLAKSEWEAMRRAIGSLPARQRQILLAVFGENVSHAALAARHGLTVRWIQHEVRTALAHCAEMIGRK